METNEEKPLGDIACEAFHNAMPLGREAQVKARWEATAAAVITEHERRNAVEREKEADLKQAIHEFVNKPNREIPWIQWHGGPCPLKADEVDLLEVRFKDDSTTEYVNPLSPDWAHRDCPSNIVAYRVLKWKVKPEWKLPDPPDGEQWHRTDWTKRMLPDGYRPLLLGEVNVPGVDERECGGMRSGEWLPLSSVEASASHHPHLRTNRPLPVKHAMVELGPDDVPPFSAVRANNPVLRKPWIIPQCVGSLGVEILGNSGETILLTYEAMHKESWEINRSVPLTGKWDSNAWVLCAKEVQP